MNDRELLELAAKAAKVDGLEWRNGSACYYYDDPETGREEWNPLARDGQALRLAVKLDLFLNLRFLKERDVLIFTERYPRLEATRRAIVRVAAEIGEANAQKGGAE
ncbi:hypothetical protein [Chitinimonas sp.]|uniref:hypothetical protein n=1 Tax=Chitinimonas sp. TaxID=1934313 RepID=UPI0035B17B3A